MSPKPSPDSMIHCDACGEDYSATYRRCPFCGAKNAPASAPAPYPPPAAPTRGRNEEDDGWVFDGQDVFDDESEDDDYTPVRPGKRLAEKSGGRFDFAAAPINWPRLITFICSLIIIVAALVIVFTVIYPQLSAGKPKDPDSSVSDNVDSEPSVPGTDTKPSAPVVNNPVSTDPDPADSTAPSQPATLTAMKLNRDDFTLRPESPPFQLIPTFTPADWAGTVTWTSSDESLAKVSADGTVTYAASNVTSVHRVVITASAGGIQTECVVFIAGPLNPSTPPAQSDAPQSEPPTTDPNQGSSSGGTVTVGRQGTIVNAEGGLRVRSGPGTTYEVLASLVNGSTVNVISAAEGGWYQISFQGGGGSTITGYIMGEYISTN